MRGAQGTVQSELGAPGEMLGNRVTGRCTKRGGQPAGSHASHQGVASQPSAQLHGLWIALTLVQTGLRAQRRTPQPCERRSRSHARLPGLHKVMTSIARHFAQRGAPVGAPQRRPAGAPGCRARPAVPCRAGKARQPAESLQDWPPAEPAEQGGGLQAAAAAAPAAAPPQIIEDFTNFTPDPPGHRAGELRSAHVC